VLAVGGVGYDDKPTAEIDPSQLAILRAPRANERHQWQVLPGTGREVEALKQIAGQRELLALTANHANIAQVLANLPKARWAHFATHGFFADPEFRSALEVDEEAFSERVSARDRERTTIAGRNPLVLSGLVLAGANRGLLREDIEVPVGDGGILTAEAIAGLPLSSLELAVLSACETGLGEVANGEGVFGLTRAFHLAGVRTTIASLWKVDDDATQALMVEFYRNLWEKKLGKLESLRQAQLTMLREYDPKTKRLRGPGAIKPVDPQKLEEAKGEPREPLPPLYWAGFVLSGDWR
jgi:CHAT domain-containing protein